MAMALLSSTMFGPSGRKYEKVIQCFIGHPSQFSPGPVRSSRTEENVLFVPGVRGHYGPSARRPQRGDRESNIHLAATKVCRAVSPNAQHL